MSADAPPIYYFTGIDFNSAFYTDSSGNYDPTIVHIAGTETITGQKTFSYVGQNITSTIGNSQWGDVLSLSAVTTGNYNTAIGKHSGVSITTGTYNTLVGSYSGDSIVGSSRNTLIGKSSGHLINANDNTAVGSESLFSCVSGINNTAVGSGALNKSTASDNTAIGNGSGGNWAGLVNNVDIGSGAGFNAVGNNRVSVGYYAGNNNQGAGCVAIGYQAGKGNIAGQQPNSICIGYQAGVDVCASNAILVSTSAQNGNAANSIVLNASGASIVAGTSSATYITPVRNTAISGASLLQYDNTTNEMTYSNILNSTLAGEANPLLTLNSTDATANGTFMKIDKTPLVENANDTIGGIIFTGNNSASSEITYGKIATYAPVVTAGAERSKMSFQLAVAGTPTEYLALNSQSNNINIAPQGANTFFGSVTSSSLYFGSTPASAVGMKLLVSSGLTTQNTRISATGSAYKLRGRVGGDPEADAYNILEAGITTTDTTNYLTIGNSTIPANASAYGNVACVGNGFYSGAGITPYMYLPLSNTAGTTYNIRFLSYDPTLVATTTNVFTSGTMYGVAMYFSAGTIINRVTLHQFVSGGGNISVFLYRKDGTLIGTGLSISVPAGSNRCFTASFTAAQTIATSDIYFIGFYPTIANANFGAITNNFSMFQTAAANVYDMRAMSIVASVPATLTGTATNLGVVPFMMIS